MGILNSLGRYLDLCAIFLEITGVVLQRHRTDCPNFFRSNGDISFS